MSIFFVYYKIIIANSVHPASEPGMITKSTSINSSIVYPIETFDFASILTVSPSAMAVFVYSKHTEPMGDRVKLLYTHSVFVQYIKKTKCDGVCGSL